MPDGTVSDTALTPALAKRGRLQLSFTRAPAGRTFLSKQFSSYPFHLCRPLYLDDGSMGGMATIYTQSCSGGLYSLDRLATMIEVGPNAQAQVTSQASTIIHRATYGGAEQFCEISAAAGALVEYLPEAAILFPGARLKSATTLRVDAAASAILFDSFLTHDPSDSGQVFDLFENDLRVITPEGKPLAIDRFRVTGADFARSGIGRMGGFTCHGSVIVIAPGVDIERCIANARESLVGFEDGAIGISQLPLANGFSARIIARDAIPLKRATLSLWNLARMAITGHPPKPRRK